MTARRLLLLVVAAVLMSLGFVAREAPAHPQPGTETETVAIDQSLVDATPPMREIGRLAADPGLLKVQSVTEVAGAEPVLVRLGEQDEDVPLVSRVVALPVSGDRGPPVRQAVL
ncbi:hypothetical protein KIPE111705_30300 [Kibdelosporangium persicum]|uniref:Uncharacterized protein n=1 Tax=Kibdelosporangium persicum TaxID=2698649 RepID=A0ABX2F2B5_9PSEU|nr:hypothetical protein [Kibdelosporangium persicum]NRN65023.1 hypothetical protein [Kibdelosporangium persicum]